MSLTVTERITGVDITKTLHKVSDLTGRTITGPDGRTSNGEFVMIGGVKLLGNNLIFLDSADANKWGANGANLVAAVSNNTLAAYANTGGANNLTLIITSVGA